MKTNLIFVFGMIMLFLVIGNCKEIVVEMKESSDRINADKLKGFPNIVYMYDLAHGTSEVFDLNTIGIDKPVSYVNDDNRNVLFVNEYIGQHYNIKVIDLTDKKLIKTININDIDPDAKMIVDSTSGLFYVTHYDQTGQTYCTLIFNGNYEQIFKISDFSAGRAFTTRNGRYSYIVGNDLKQKEGQLILFDNVQAQIIRVVLLTDLAVKGEYAEVRDGKDGKLLLEYRNDEKYKTYFLYDPIENKVLSKIDKVTWHVGNVYLDDSLSKIVINDAKFVAVNNKTVRKYTNNILVYSFNKANKVKEIPIKKGAKIEAVKDRIYIKQDSLMTVEKLD